MIHSNTEVERSALNELFPHVKHDVKGTMEAMDGYPVTFRTLDPRFMNSYQQDKMKEKNSPKFRYLFG